MIPVNTPDFDTDKSAKHRDTRSFPNSGVKAGVVDGLSMVENLKRGSVEAEQMSHRTNFRQDYIESPAESKDGKSFKFKY